MYSSKSNYTWQAAVPVVAQESCHGKLCLPVIVQLSEEKNGILPTHFLGFKSWLLRRIIHAVFTTREHHQLSLSSFSYTLLTLPSFPYPSPQHLPTSSLPQFSLLLQKSNAKLVEGINNSTDTVATPTEALDLVAILHWSQ